MFQYFLAHIKRFCNSIYLSVNKLTNYKGCQNVLFICMLTVIIKHVGKCWVVSWLSRKVLKVVFQCYFQGTNLPILRYKIVKSIYCF